MIFFSSFSYALHISNMCFFFPLAITNINMLQTRSIRQSVSHPRPYEATIQIHSPCCSCEHSCELYISISVCLFCVLVAALHLRGRLGCMSVASNWGLINLFFHSAILLCRAPPALGLLVRAAPSETSLSLPKERLSFLRDEHETLRCLTFSWRETNPEMPPLCAARYSHLSLPALATRFVSHIARLQDARSGHGIKAPPPMSSALGLTSRSVAKGTQAHRPLPWHFC